MRSYIYIFMSLTSQIRIPCLYHAHSPFKFGTHIFPFSHNEINSVTNGAFSLGFSFSFLPFPPIPISLPPISFSPNKHPKKKKKLEDSLFRSDHEFEIRFPPEKEIGIILQFLPRINHDHHKPNAVALAVPEQQGPDRGGAGAGVQEVRREWRRQDLVVGARIHLGQPGASGHGRGAGQDDQRGGRRRRRPHRPPGIRGAEHQGRGFRRGVGEYQGRVLGVRHRRERFDIGGGVARGVEEPQRRLLARRVPEDDQRRRLQWGRND